MEYLYAIGYIVGWLLVIITIRFVTTTIHELGHAIPALLYTNGKVQIHIGSYGDETGKRMEMGRLSAFFKFDPTQLNMGLCRRQQATTIQENIRIILGGPVFSLLLGLFLGLILIAFSLSDAAILVVTAFIISAVWDFFINLIPMTDQVRLHDGRLISNDGQQLINNLRIRRYPPVYHKAQAYFKEGDYQSAIVNFRKTIESGYSEKGVYFDLVQSLLKQRNYTSALHCCEEIDQKFKLKPNDFAQIAHVFSKNKNYSKAIECLDQVIHHKYNDPIAHNNRGYAYLMQENYVRAQADFNSAIIHNPKYAPSYNNLALVFLKKGEPDKVLPLIEKSRALQPENPYLALHSGYYYEALKEYDKALHYFDEAKQQEIDFDGIDRLIHSMQEKLNNLRSVNR